MKSLFLSLRGRGAGFWFLHLGLPLLLGLLLWRVYPQTGLDYLVEDWFYDRRLHVFPWRDHILMTAGMHAGLKTLVLALAIAVFLVWIGSLLGLVARSERRRLGWVWVGIGLASLAVSLLKQTSIHHCPWDIVDYGGYAPHLELFDRLPEGIKAGRCFPGGHASGGFALMALYFGLRDDYPRWAAAGLLFGLALGGVMGWGQTMRGAHFLSHTLWSAWVVWLVLLLCYLLFPPVRRTHR